MKNSDKIFLFSLLFAIGLVILDMCIKNHILATITMFWWAPLLPLAMAKALFPNSKLVEWMNKTT